MKEFNMIPNSKYKRLNHHKYIRQDFEILKLSSIYGANAAGKSNLVKSIKIVKDIIEKEDIPNNIDDIKYKFLNETDENSITIALEFYHSGKFFYYAIKIDGKVVLTEELYESGLGRKADLLIFERNTDRDGKTTLKFMRDFENDKESQVLKNVIEKNLCKPNKSVMKLLTTLENKFLEDVSNAYNWFKDTLEIIRPSSKPRAIAHYMDLDEDFHEYAKNILCSFHVGIKDVSSEKKSYKKFFGNIKSKELNEALNSLEELPESYLKLGSSTYGEELVIVKEKDDFMVKRLKLIHEGKNGKKAIFRIFNESDGTKRLLDFLPALRGVVNKEKVYIIDEIERSIHPLLIKELVKKFSDDENTNGQLIFSTHESNLLDQNIFRPDEIWFAEKDLNGCTDLYSLSDFKEHSTIDIRKGYLSGRYGSIPFLGNIKELNWHNDDINK